MKFFLLLLVSVFLFKANVTAKNYYISASGNDQNSGTSDTTAWKTINKLNSFFAGLLPGDSVLFKRGDEFYGTLKLVKSGSSSSAIILGAYGNGAKPVITGFTDVSGWSNVGGNIWQSATISNAPSRVNMLTVNGIVTAMGRYPNGNAANKGYLTIDSHDSSLSITDQALPSSPSWTGGELVLRRNRWIIDRDSIKNHSGTKIYYYPYSSGSKPINGFGYFIQNHPSTLDINGEWYFNPSAKTIKIYSTSTPSLVKIATLSNLLTASSISNVKIQDLSFTGANSTAIDISGSGSNISITNCDISYSGVQGIDTNNNNFSLQNSTISFSLNKGVSLTGDRSVMRNCLVKNTGYIAGMGNSGDGQYFGVIIAGKGSLMEYCEVDSTGYVAVHLNSDSSVVKNNLINTFCFIKDDAGGIYTANGSGTNNWSGRKITGNIVLNGTGAMDGTNTTFPDAFGIYLDDKSNHLEITNNTISNNSFSGIFIHNSHDVIMRGNTFFDNNKYQVRMTHDAIAPNDPIRNVTAKNNIEFAKTSSQLVGYYGSTSNDISKFGSFDSNYYCRPMLEPYVNSSISSSDGAIIDIVVNYAAGKYFSLARWKDSTHLDSHSNKTSKSISDTSQIRFEYNATQLAKTIDLGSYSYIGVDNKKYTQSVVLQPYTSIILLKDSLSKPSSLTASSSATPILCYGNTSTVTVTAAGGVPPYTGTGTFQVGAGTYNYIIVDANKNKDTISVTISQPSSPLQPSASASAIKCFGGSTTITVTASGGVAPYTGTGTFTVPQGNYNYPLTDANGCKDTAFITITQPGSLTSSLTVPPIACSSTTTSITVNVTGGKSPFLYSLNSGTYQTSNVFNNITAGNYLITTKDANECIVSGSTTVTQPSNNLSLSLNTKSDPSCKRGTNGLIQVNATGGTSPYLYNINNGSFSSGNTFNNLKAGTYSIFAKDKNGCTTSLSVTLKDGTGSCHNATNAVKREVPGDSAVSTVSANLKATAFPNPSQTEFILSIENNSLEEVHIQVTNLFGAKVYTGTAKERKQIIFGNNFLPGIYFAKITQGKNIQLLKLIKGSF